MYMFYTHLRRSESVGISLRWETQLIANFSTVFILSIDKYKFIKKSVKIIWATDSLMSSTWHKQQNCQLSNPIWKRVKDINNSCIVFFRVSRTAVTTLFRFYRVLYNYNYRQKSNSGLKDLVEIVIGCTSFKLLGQK